MSDYKEIEEEMAKRNYFYSNRAYKDYQAPVFQKEKTGPYTIKDGEYVFDESGREYSVMFVFEKDSKEPVFQVCKNALTSGAMMDAYNYIAENLVEKYPNEFDLRAYQKEYYDPALKDEGLHYEKTPELFAEKLHRKLDLFDPSMRSIEADKISIKELEQTVDRELVDSSKKSSASKISRYFPFAKVIPQFREAPAPQFTCSYTFTRESHVLY